MCVSRWKKPRLLPMCEEIFCSIKITAAMNWTFQCTGPFVIFDASLRGHKLNWMNFTWWSVWFSRDGKKIEQSNSPAACEKVESVQKRNVHSGHYSSMHQMSFQIIIELSLLIRLIILLGGPRLFYQYNLIYYNIATCTFPVPMKKEKSASIGFGNNF